jgi:hypothetical protein
MVTMVSALTAKRNDIDSTCRDGQMNVHAWIPPCRINTVLSVKEPSLCRIFIGTNDVKTDIPPCARTVH